MEGCVVHVNRACSVQVSLYGIEGQGLGPRCALLAVSDFREEERGAMTGITEDVFCDSLEESSFDVHVLH